MKKIVCLVMAIALALLAFTACSGTSTKSAAATTAAAAATTAAAKTEAAAATTKAATTTAATTTSGTTSGATAVETATKDLKVKKGMKIGLTVYDLGNPYFVTVQNGAQAKCDELGIELVTNDPKSDSAAQVTAIDNFITMGVDAIICCPLDTAAVEGSLQKAKEAGIKIVSQSSCSDTRDVWVSADEWDMGHVAGDACGKWLEQKFGKDSKPTVAVLSWSKIATQIKRGDGMEDGIKEHVAGANVIRQDANTTEQGQSVADSLLQANPDLCAVVCINDATGIGVLSAVQAANKDNDNFYIGAIDATQEGLELVKANNCYRGTVDLIPYENGGIDVELCVQLVNGEKVEDPYVIPAKNVDSSNVDEYLNAAKTESSSK